LPDENDKVRFESWSLHSWYFFSWSLYFFAWWEWQSLVWLFSWSPHSWCFLDFPKFSWIYPCFFILCLMIVVRRRCRCRCFFSPLYVYCLLK
jgi:hypothetical protein